MRRTRPKTAPKTVQQEGSGRHRDCPRGLCDSPKGPREASRVVVADDDDDVVDEEEDDDPEASRMAPDAPRGPNWDLNTARISEHFCVFTDVSACLRFRAFRFKMVPSKKVGGRTNDSLGALML